MDSKATYKNWTEEEIAKLVQTKEYFSGGPIDWKQIAKCFPDRTAQQCKSFYRNRVKQFVFKEENGQVKADTDFVQYCYFQNLTGFVKLNETPDEKVKRVVAQCCYEDSLTNAVIVQTDVNLKWNQKLLVGMKMVYEFHTKIQAEIDNALVGQEEVEFKGHIIQKDKWEQYKRIFSQYSDKVDYILQQIDNKIQK
ncbi:Myb-like_DNA-binding domain-containing protein [Hexamita inflata]|uniref:Myb-like DNA-binding domain-containing protein n=1 Tax=Hexamita inflata TaxID=28002 RepID=A0AA86RE14_9EUKA|nr:Myb-like DNA-binding domain-containing protein [Hexamita inflata]